MMRQLRISWLAPALLIALITALAAFAREAVDVQG